MKKLWTSFFVIIFLIFNLTACQPTPEKNASLSTIYGICALISFFLLIACFLLVKKHKTWFLMLYSSVLIVNVGYTLLSLSTNLETALWANRISYLGSVFLCPAMLLIILNVTNTTYKKYLPIILLCFAKNLAKIAF